MKNATNALLASVSLAILVSAPGSAQAKPKFVPPATIIHNTYDGTTNDLLTAGLGTTGLGSLVPPGFADPLNPTAEELRRLAIYNNYRALVDPTVGGGYTTLYGPNIDPSGNPTLGEGKIAGDEYIAFASDRGSGKNVTMMVQVPASFNPAEACIVTAPSSGSRGVYGAIATAGEWGLKRGCAVAYTDKGTGTGAHNLQTNTINLIRGERADAAVAGDDSNFTADLSDAERAAFNAATPNRFAFKHAHSQENPEADWGQNVIESIRFAFHVLGQQYGTPFNKNNTLVIASSVSNGGGASVLAAEQDKEGLIDGLAVGEPNVNPKYEKKLWIVQDGYAPLNAHSRPLIDYTTLVNVYQGCASVAHAGSPLNFAPSPGSCASLKAKGLLTATTLADQAIEAQQVINNYGILTEQNRVQPGYWFANVPQSISVTYANTYGRFSVADNLCDFSFGVGVPPTGVPPLPAATEASMFGTSNGIPPTSGLALINNAAPGTPTENRASTPDQNLDGALCLRALATGKSPAAGWHLTGKRRVQANRIDHGVHDILATGRLDGVPAIFVTGRNDAILPPNHTSRAYYGLNQIKDGRKSNLRYYEVTNAQHLDSFNQFAGYNETMIPLHRYYIQAMDMMYAHLLSGTALPPSQVVHTTPRGPGAPPITPSNVPPISSTPASSDVITMSGGRLHIPN